MLGPRLHSVEALALLEPSCLSGLGAYFAFPLRGRLTLAELHIFRRSDRENAPLIWCWSAARLF